MNRFKQVLLTLLFATLSPAALSAVETLAADSSSALTRQIASAEGELALQLGDGSHHRALLQHTDVRFSIAGLLVRSRITQRFRNDSTLWAEGVYSFPLPEDSAVDHLRMKIGERIIEGRIREREQARKTYQQAKNSGRKASLIEQQRPNIFTTSVANIAPGEEIEIEIEYQQTAHYDSGTFSLRFPLVVAPRYIPGNPLSATGSSESRHGDQPLQTSPPAAVFSQNTEINATALGWSQPTDQVADAHLITPPVAEPGETITNRVSISADLNSGFALRQISSSYHPVNTRMLGTGRARIELSQGPVAANRDFELLWTPEPGSAPQAALLTHQQPASGGAGDLAGLRDDSYGLLMVLPPALESDRPPLPRSLTLVLDISGSMHGDSIMQAKQSLNRAIEHLNPEDYFNLIVFSDRTRSLFAEPQPASRRNRNTAGIFLSGLQADGGTEMAPAISRALNQPQRAGYVHQLLFVTDGAVGNEDALFRLISTQLRDQRLFTVGIGSAPNSHFMTKAAQLGRGTFTYIGGIAEVRSRMDQLLAKLASPQMTDIRIEGAEMLSYPDPIPDLYRGEPLLLSFRAGQLPQHLTISGSTAERRWQQQLTLKQGASQPAVAVLWARKRIAALMDQHRRAPQKQRSELRRQVVDTALEHHLVSRFTSLVAVDVTPARPATDALHTQAEKVQLPEGWSHQKVFGMARTATPAAQQILIGSLLLLFALVLLLIRRRYDRAETAALQLRL